MTRYDAYISEGWHEHGLVQLMVARRRGGGSADVGFFLVDVWCLGVKDAFFEGDMPESLLEALLDERIPKSMREAIHPACARKLVEGAVAYAENLGFSPHRDYRKARKVFSGIEAHLCPTTFAFGREGRPCFVAGPDDSDERVDRVLAMLDARVGPDGYDFEDEDDDIAVVREELMKWLVAEPPEVPRFYQLSGLIAAMHLCPELRSPLDVREVLWPKERIWKDAAEVQMFLDWLKAYWNYLLERVYETASDPDPLVNVVDIWESDLEGIKAEKDDPRPYIASLVEWTTGFWLATRRWPEAWADVLTRKDLAGHWNTVRWWGELLDHPERVRRIGEDPAGKNIGPAIKALVTALAPRPDAPK